MKILKSLFYYLPVFFISKNIPEYSRYSIIVLLK